MVIIPIVSKGLGPSYCLLSLSPSFNDNLHMSTSLLQLQQTQNHVWLISHVCGHVGSRPKQLDWHTTGHTAVQLIPVSYLLVHSILSAGTFSWVEYILYYDCSTIILPLVSCTFSWRAGTEHRSPVNTDQNRPPAHRWRTYICGYLNGGQCNRSVCSRSYACVPPYNIV